MNKVIFREYDIRGLVNTDFILSETPQLAHAIAFFINEKNLSSKIIIIGQDARPTSPDIAHQIKNAFIAVGFTVYDIGIVPSPVAYFAHHYFKAAAVLVITASHNPVEYNGIKIVVDNKPVWGSQIQLIYQYYQEKKIVLTKNMGSTISVDALAPYISYMVDQFQSLQNKDIAVAFESAYATAGVVIPALIKAMGWRNAHSLHDTVGFDHSYPADPVVACNMKYLQNVVIEKKLRYGIGFDGDADRMNVVTDKKLLSGDCLLALFIGQIHRKNPHFTALCNVTMSQLLFDYSKKLGISLIMVPTGHAIIESKMNEYGAILAGESSCHFFFKDRYFGYDDGIYAALRFIELTINESININELIDSLPSYALSPEYRISCQDSNKFLFVLGVVDYCQRYRQDLELITIDGVRILFPNGWAIIRAANTQPVLSIRCEGKTRQDLLAIKKEVYDILKTSISVNLSIECLLGDE